jgi:hypothetical protein
MVIVIVKYVQGNIISLRHHLLHDLPGQHHRAISQERESQQGQAWSACSTARTLPDQWTALAEEHAADAKSRPDSKAMEFGLKLLEAYNYRRCVHAPS